jgi:hypothetical protein
MIHVTDILAYHQARPFEPFDIRVSDGRVYTIDHPEFLAVSRNGNALYFSTDDGRLITIAIGQITTLEKRNAPRAA